MTLGRSKTLSSTRIWCLIAFDEINTLCDFLDFVGKLWIYPQMQKIMILSQVIIAYPMRMFDMVLKCSKDIILIFQRAYRGFCTFKITNTYYWLPLPPILSLFTIDYHHLLLQLLPLPLPTTVYHHLWLLPPPLPTIDYHDLLLPPPPPVLLLTTTTTSTGKLVVVVSLPTLLLPPLHHIIATTATTIFKQRTTTLEIDNHDDVTTTTHNWWW